MEDNALVRLAAPNLTPAGTLGELSDVDWFRAVAHGVDRTGRSLVVMPARELSTFSDRDLAAIIAYVKSVPPVVRDVGASTVSLLGSVVFGLTGADLFSAEGLDHERGPTTAPAAGATREYGMYLVNSCRGCHGPELRGGITVHPGAPPSSDISPAAMREWSFAEFEQALRVGRRRDGSLLDAAMPWNATKGLSYEELRALYLALCQK